MKVAASSLRKGAVVDLEGKLYVVLTAENIHPGNERKAIEAASRLLDRLAPEDRVAVVTLPRGTVEADLSTDRAAARAAFERIIGHAPRNMSKYNISIAEAFAVAADRKAGAIKVVLHP